MNYIIVLKIVWSICLQKFQIILFLWLLWDRKMNKKFGSLLNSAEKNKLIELLGSLDSYQLF
jgi:hypothetical protein